VGHGSPPPLCEEVQRPRAHLKDARALEHWRGVDPNGTKVTLASAVHEPITIAYGPLRVCGSLGPLDRAWLIAYYVHKRLCRACNGHRFVDQVMAGASTRPRVVLGKSLRTSGMSRGCGSVIKTVLHEPHEPNQDEGRACQKHDALSYPAGAGWPCEVEEAPTCHYHQRRNDESNDPPPFRPTLLPVHA
jgi:hypothetical protein